MTTSYYKKNKKKIHKSFVVLYLYDSMTFKIFNDVTYYHPYHLPIIIFCIVNCYPPSRTHTPPPTPTKKNLNENTDTLCVTLEKIGHFGTLEKNYKLSGILFV